MKSLGKLLVIFTFCFFQFVTYSKVYNVDDWVVVTKEGEAVDAIHKKTGESLGKIHGIPLEDVKVTDDKGLIK
ncbi:MAG: hypothetical protein DRQ88_08355 [Epsilonproteobacteria bacterium]|nr:MAG: hypothetical protein DRQ89_06705 [Campylobacterota bacterium]RLA65940.1 MAG: hypothetical protein DRQ88_08355 [Campylobacterota bacterium]